MKPRPPSRPRKPRRRSVIVRRCAVTVYDPRGQGVTFIWGGKPAP